MTVPLPPMPDAITALPRDERGYPIPWFTAFIDGKPEFRCSDPQKWLRCVKEKLCWVCGRPLHHKQQVWVLGPLSGITGSSSEPPCHEQCAEFSVKACPFLSRPAAVRREAVPGSDHTGLPVLDNPGVTLLWYGRGYRIVEDQRGLPLFRIPAPAMVRWWSQGRKATREEILAAIELRLPHVREAAKVDGPDSVIEVEQRIESLLRLVPKT